MKNEIYKKLQELLPDYVFNRLNIEDKKFFEENYINFPDLIQEVKEVREVFNRFDKINFDNILNNKTRNISVKVIEKRAKNYNYKQINSFSYLIRYALPVAIIITFLIYLYEKSNVENSLNDYSYIETADILENELDYFNFYNDDVLALSNSDEKFMNNLINYIDEEFDVIAYESYDNLIFLSDLNFLSDEDITFLIQELTQ